MADPLEASLQRSLVRGLQVLERASQRKVDWTQVRAVNHRLGPAVGENPEETQALREQCRAVELRAAFSSICSFMTQTSAHCQKYHGSLSSLSDTEHTHVWRFHRGASGPRPSVAMETQLLEDFHIEVSPGTYSVTASDPQSPRQHTDPESPQRQTRLVSLGDGESVLLTFHL